MIRVNLLPVKELLAAVNRRRELTLGAIILGGATVILLGLFLKQTYDLSAINNELTSLRSEIQALNTKVKQVGDLQNKIKDLTAKHKVIADLNRKKAGPVGVMESLSAATPSRLWLTEFREIGARVTITGFAADNPTVAEFLTALAKTDHFRQVELVETTQSAKEAGPYKRFSIRAAVLYLPQAPAAAPVSVAPAPAKGEKKS
jgi:type IV pilus assembly protein PilN